MGRKCGMPSCGRLLAGKTEPFLLYMYLSVKIEGLAVTCSAAHPFNVAASKGLCTLELHHFRRLFMARWCSGKSSHCDARYKGQRYSRLLTKVFVVAVESVIPSSHLAVGGRQIFLPLTFPPSVALVHVPYFPYPRQSSIAAWCSGKPSSWRLLKG